MGIHSCSAHGGPRAESNGTRYITSFIDSPLPCLRPTSIQPQLLSFPPSPSVTEARLSRQITSEGRVLQSHVQSLSLNTATLESKPSAS